jgi:hypothetical protein
MIRAMRRVLPPPIVLWPFCVFYAIILGVELIVNGMAAGAPVEPSIAVIRARIMLVACVAYGFHRVVTLHPLCRPTYFAWLRTTPWTSRLRLPLGPISLAWQDAIVLILLMLLASGTTAGMPVNLLLAFSIGYLAALGLVLAVTGVYVYPYVCLFGLGLITRLWGHLEIGLGIAVVLYVLGVWTLRRSLAAFPWDPKVTERAEQISLYTRAAARATTNGLRTRCHVGFPYFRLKRYDAAPLVPLRHAIVISLSLAWWAYVISWADTRNDEPVAELLFCLWLPFMAALMRCIRYCAEYIPPISLFGRVFTWSWIIPGYDRVLIVPLATLVTSYGLVLLMYLFEIPFRFGAPVITFVALALALGGGPTLGSWRLTGSHRIIAAMSKQEMIRL